MVVTIDKVIERIQEQNRKTVGMKDIVFKRSIQRKVDTEIQKGLSQHQAIISIQEDLYKKLAFMVDSLHRVNPSRDFDEDTFKELNWLDNFENIREKYFLYYIYFLSKRIDDLQWILDNRYKGFYHLWNHQVFKMLKLKEKLDPRVEVVI